MKRSKKFRESEEDAAFNLEERRKRRAKREAEEEENLRLEERKKRKAKREAEEEEILRLEERKKRKAKRESEEEEEEVPSLEERRKRKAKRESEEDTTSGGADAYKKFFQEKLSKYGVESPAELEDDKKKEFFAEIEKEWKSDSEVNETRKIIEGSGSITEAIQKLLEAKVGTITFSDEAVKTLVAAGFREMKDSDYRGWGDAPRGSYIYEKGNVEGIAGPESNKIHLELGYFGDEDGDDGTVYWDNITNMLSKLKGVMASLSKAKSYPDFRDTAKSNGAKEF